MARSLAVAMICLHSTPRASSTRCSQGDNRVITFDLRCSSAHRFEGWFSSSADYDRQQSDGLISCPICNDSLVTKAPSAPYVGRKGSQSVRAARPEVSPSASETPPQAQPETAALSNAPQSPAAISAMIQKLATVQAEVLKDSTWVGRDFAEEARAIHYGETDDRRIHGEASPDEAQALSDEGIAVAALPLPIVPPNAKN